MFARLHGGRMTGLVSLEFHFRERSLLAGRKGKCPQINSRSIPINSRQINSRHTDLNRFTASRPPMRADVPWFSRTIIGVPQSGFEAEWER